MCNLTCNIFHRWIMVLYDLLEGNVMMATNDNLPSPPSDMVSDRPFECLIFGVAVKTKRNEKWLVSFASSCLSCMNFTVWMSWTNHTSAHTFFSISKTKYITTAHFVRSNHALLRSLVLSLDPLRSGFRLLQYPTTIIWIRLSHVVKKIVSMKTLTQLYWTYNP